MTAWQMEFDYIESCNCAAACPCPFSGAPTQGHCDLVMGFHIVRGTYGSVPLKGRTAVMIVDVPGNMRAGGYRTGIYIDEGGDAAQRAAVEAIFTGKAGGVFESLAALTDEWLGVKHVPIEMSTRRSVLAVPQAGRTAGRDEHATLGPQRRRSHRPVRKLLRRVDIYLARGQDARMWILVIAGLSVAPIFLGFLMEPGHRLRTLHRDRRTHRRSG